MFEKNLSGSGLLSKEVLKLPNVRQVVGIEDAQVFAPKLHVSRQAFQFTIASATLSHWKGFFREALLWERLLMGLSLLM